MALQGINLPLAFTAQEAIWQKVFMVSICIVALLYLVAHYGVLIITLKVVNVSGACIIKSIHTIS